jgi:hypothetical protein
MQSASAGGEPAEQRVLSSDCRKEAHAENGTRFDSRDAMSAIVSDTQAGAHRLGDFSRARRFAVCDGNVLEDRMT